MSYATDLFSTESLPEARGYIEENKGLFIFLGIMLLFAGLFALAFPLASTVAITLILGVAMLAGGIANAIHAFSARSWGGTIFQLVEAVIYVLGGLFIMFNPLEGVLALTVVLAILFIVDGIIRSVLSLRLRPVTGWGWMLVGGLLSILLGLMLAAKFPFSAAWAPGVLAGVNFLVWGVTILLMTSGYSGPEKLKTSP